MEDALQRWGLDEPEDAHVYYSRVAQRYDIVARRVPYVDRWLVGAHDLNNREIVVVAMTDGPIQAAIRRALSYLGSTLTLTPNPQWTG